MIKSAVVAKVSAIVGKMLVSIKTPYLVMIPQRFSISYLPLRKQIHASCFVHFPKNEFTKIDQ